MNAPFVRGGELLDGALVDDAGDSSLKGCSGSEGPHGGSLSPDRDLRGGIREGLGGHEAGVRKDFVVEI